MVCARVPLRGRRGRTHRQIITLMESADTVTARGIKAHWRTVRNPMVVLQVYRTEVGTCAVRPDTPTARTLDGVVFNVSDSGSRIA